MFVDWIIKLFANCDCVSIDPITSLSEVGSAENILNPKAVFELIPA